MMKHFILLFFIGALIASYPSFSQVQNIHLSWNSSKKHATEKTMAITWSAKKLNKGMVKYGVDSSLSKSQQQPLELGSVSSGLLSILI